MSVRHRVVRLGWGYLALVLLLAPLLGLMHGVVHGTGGPHHAAAPHAHADNPGHPHAPDARADGHTHEHAGGHGWLADLFSVHADAADCRVYDQLCHSDLIEAPPALLLPIAFSSVVFHVLEGEVLARWAALFEARAPPPVR